MREKVVEALKEYQRMGILTPVQTADWGTPLVPILKEDGSVRICADYKITINKHLVDNRHPLPIIEDIFNALEGGQTFTILDLDMAYNQLELDDESRKLVAWSTCLGVFLVNRLPPGVKPATGIFQHILHVLLAGIPGVFIF